jgi:purine-binding chemotaxis protein CheW
MLSNKSANGRQINKADLLSQKEQIEYQMENEEEQLSQEELVKIWERRAKQLAKPPEIEAVGATIDLLVFRLGKERYGVNVANVREIYPLEKITPVPRTPKFVVGVFSARGRILSVVDLHAFWGMTPNKITEDSELIAVVNTMPSSDMTDMELGILADQVEDVITVFRDEIDPSFITRSNTAADYMQGITGDLLEVIDLNVLLEDKQLLVNDEVL